jgi:acetoacetate decarboxylase
MPTGFSVPFSATGRSATAPSPPWHYVGDYLAVEFWTDPQAVAALLPAPLTAGEDPGKCALFFSDCQYATDDGDEPLDPAVSQYRECLLVVSATHEGKPSAFMPFIFVDNDNSMVRGLIQGMPKQLGVVRMTRTYAVPSKAAPGLGAGARFGASLSYRDRMLVRARVTLEELTDQAPNRMMARLINRRHFPDLSLERHGQPLVHQLVRQKVRDVRISEIHTGPAELEFLPQDIHELASLRPLRVGAGYRYSFAMTIDDLTVVADLAH